MESVNQQRSGSVSPRHDIPLYPLRFEPVLQYRLWGGRRLEDWLGTKLPGDQPIGEAWLLSDREDCASVVADGPLKGQTLTDLMRDVPEALMGRLQDLFPRFPLLLKFLDVNKMLSVQVHPPDDRADLVPAGENGKTEAWLVLEARPDGRIYAGLKSGTTAEDLRTLSTRTANDHLPGFRPAAGQGVFIEAGTVHAMGDGVVVFEVQENSDITFRLYDWDHVDPKTGKKRDLQVDKALSCIDFQQGEITPVVPVQERGEPVTREQLFNCRHFRMWRMQGSDPFTVGVTGEPRVLVCIGGDGAIESDGASFPMAKGTVMLMPAAVGARRFRPGAAVTLLELAIPERL